MKNQVIIKGKQLKKKGLAMPSDMMQNPEKYKNRVCVAYDVEGKANPYMYVLVGSYTKQNEHDIRYLYTKTTCVKYSNTRVIFWKHISSELLTQRHRLSTFRPLLTLKPSINEQI